VICITYELAVTVFARGEVPSTKNRRFLQKVGFSKAGRRRDKFDKFISTYCFYYIYFNKQVRIALELQVISMLSVPMGKTRIQGLGSAQSTGNR
jgi:hypothetical protein